MENNSQIDSGFRILNLLLLECHFKREVTVTFDPVKTTNNVKVDVNVQIKDNTIFVTENLLYTQQCSEKIEVTAHIQMLGIFEKYGESILDLENFGRINGAAIIFPYIREHLTNLSAKAGVGLIMLPPFNFTQKEKK